MRNRHTNPDKPAFFVGLSSGALFLALLLNTFGTGFTGYHPTVPAATLISHTPTRHIQAPHSQPSHRAAQQVRL